MHTLNGRMLRLPIPWILLSAALCFVPVFAGYSGLDPAGRDDIGSGTVEPTHPQRGSLGTASLEEITPRNLSNSTVDFAGKIVLSASLSPGARWDIFVINPDGSYEVNLTADFDADAWGPRISPDGQRIAFGSNSGGGNGIWVMNADGSGKTKLPLDPEPHGPALGNWLNNNTLIYYSGPESGYGRLRAVDLDGLNDRVLIDYPLFGNNNVGIDPRYSPAADLIVFLAQTGSRSPTYDLYLANPDGSNPRVFFEDPDDDTIDRHPIWSRDGQTIYWSRPFAPGVNHFFEIVCRSLDSTLPMGQPDAVLLPYAGVWAVPQVTAPDDKSLLASLGDGRLVLIDLDSGSIETIAQFDSIGGADWAAMLSVLETEDFATWIARWGLPPDKQGPADRNGPLDLPNLLAYALGVNPFTARPGDLPAVQLHTHAGQRQLGFLYRLSKIAADIEVRVVNTPSLEEKEPDWQPVTATPTRLGDTPDGLAELWQVTVPVDVPTRFLRLEVRLLSTFSLSPGSTGSSCSSNSMQSIASNHTSWSSPGTADSEEPSFNNGCCDIRNRCR